MTDGNTYNATVEELVKRIVALGPQVLEMESAWDLHKAEGFKCDDLGPSFGQAQHAFARAINILNQQKEIDRLKEIQKNSRTELVYAYFERRIKELENLLKEALEERDFHFLPEGLKTRIVTALEKQNSPEEKNLRVMTEDKVEQLARERDEIDEMLHKAVHRESDLLDKFALITRERNALRQVEVQRLRQLCDERTENERLKTLLRDMCIGHDDGCKCRACKEVFRPALGEGE